MGHSMTFQMELYITKLEQVAEKLIIQGGVLKKHGHDDLAEAAFAHAEQLKLAAVALRHIMST